MNNRRIFCLYFIWLFTILCGVPSAVFAQVSTDSTLYDFNTFINVAPESRCPPGLIRDAASGKCSCPSGQEMLFSLTDNKIVFGKCANTSCINATITAQGLETVLNKSTAGNQDTPVLLKTYYGNVLLMHENDALADGENVVLRMLKMSSTGDLAMVADDPEYLLNQNLPVSSNLISGSQDVGDMTITAYPENYILAVYHGVNITGDNNLNGQAIRVVSQTGFTTTDKEQLVNVTIAGNQQNGKISAISNNNVVVVWEGAGGGDDFGIFQRIFDPDNMSSPVTGEIIVNTATNGGFNEYAPDVTKIEANRYLVVYTGDGGSSNHDVFFRMFDNSGVAVAAPTVTTPQKVNEFTAGTQNNPKVAALSSGIFMVAWDSTGTSGSVVQDGGGKGVYGKIYEKNGAFKTHEFKVSSYVPGDQALNDLIVLDGNYFLAVWTSSTQDSATAGVYGQIFNGRGIQVGAEFKLNQTGTANEQTTPAVVNHAPGQFFAAWDTADATKDGALNAVIGRKFTYSVPSTCY